MNVSTMQLVNGAVASAVNRMTLDQAQGPTDMPIRVVFYGPEGVGKSTFAAGAPKPFFLRGDSRSFRIKVKGLKPATYTELIAAIKLFLKPGHGFKTLVLDSVNWFEPLIIADVVGTSGKSIEDWNGGFGRGTTALLGRWEEVIFWLERVWETGMNIIFTVHSKVKKFDDPKGPSYDRYELAMNDKVAGKIKQWSDFVLFGEYESFGKVEPTSKKVIGLSTDHRVIHTKFNAAFDAKWVGTPPVELDLSWTSFMAAVVGPEELAGQCLQRIEEGLKALADPKVEETVRDWIKEAEGNPDRLVEIENAVTAKIGDQQ